MATNKITESAIEELAIELLEKQGYQYIYAPEIALIATLRNGTDLKMSSSYIACAKPSAESTKRAS